MLVFPRVYCGAYVYAVTRHGISTPTVLIAMKHTTTYASGDSTAFPVGASDPHEPTLSTFGRLKLPECVQVRVNDASELYTEMDECDDEVSKRIYARVLGKLLHGNDAVQLEAGSLQ